ncbi:hypothetical protein ULMS_29090 [Patiriisocius marinistellae]|uniref:Uncharacterized protein n=1 Tax=Patiriisocius marinistellae TaxID=2494560 RepID=A0A5J4G4C5_9FLAO|nr:hypothetical protein ULMS_29090 [Patiriisocius marinistellae]
MRKTIYIITLILLIIGIPLFEFMAFNSMVSLKYETRKLTDCISIVSGIDLCNAIRTFHILAILCGLIIIGLLIYRKQILKQKSENEI